MHSRTTPIARKIHWCYLCGEAIQKGEKHVKTVGVFCGDFYSERHHTTCIDIADNEYDEDDWLAHDQYEFKRHYL